jgi:neutral trehalase
MDMMGYVHDAERALARIASIQGDQDAYAKWEAKMTETASRLKARLWREEHGACFDRERADPIDNRTGDGKYVTTLVHNSKLPEELR